jgi:integrase
MAAKRKLIPADFVPGKFIRITKIVPRRKVTEAEFKLLLEHASSESFRDILICGYESAMRFSEILNLTCEQVHLDVHHISGNSLDYIDLGIFDTKTGARRTVPVSPALKSVLKRRMRGIGGESLVFTYEGHKCRPSWMDWSMRRTCENAAIPFGDKLLSKKGKRVGIVFHCLRHTRTSLWVEAGFSDEIVRRATGHRSLAAYQAYIKLDANVVMRLVAEPKRDKNSTKLAQSL